MTKLLVLICPSPAGFEVPADTLAKPQETGMLRA
jgi:hypothetical protein